MITRLYVLSTGRRLELSISRLDTLRHLRRSNFKLQYDLVEPIPEQVENDIGGKCQRWKIVYVYKHSQLLPFVTF